MSTKKEPVSNFKTHLEEPLVMHANSLDGMLPKILLNLFKEPRGCTINQVYEFTSNTPTQIRVILNELTTLIGKEPIGENFIDYHRHIGGHPWSSYDFNRLSYDKAVAVYVTSGSYSCLLVSLNGGSFALSKEAFYRNDDCELFEMERPEGKNGLNVLISDNSPITLTRAAAGCSYVKDTELECGSIESSVVGVSMNNVYHTPKLNLYIRKPMTIKASSLTNSYITDKCRFDNGNKLSLDICDSQIIYSNISGPSKFYNCISKSIIENVSLYTDTLNMTGYHLKESHLSAGGIFLTNRNGQRKLKNADASIPAVYGITIDNAVGYGELKISESCSIRMVKCKMDQERGFYIFSANNNSLRDGFFIKDDENMFEIEPKLKALVSGKKQPEENKTIEPFRPNYFGVDTLNEIPSDSIEQSMFEMAKAFIKGRLSIHKALTTLNKVNGDY